MTLTKNFPNNNIQQTIELNQNLNINFQNNQNFNGDLNKCCGCHPKEAFAAYCGMGVCFFSLTLFIFLFISMK